MFTYELDLCKGAFLRGGSATPVRTNPCDLHISWETLGSFLGFGWIQIINYSFDLWALRWVSVLRVLILKPKSCFWPLFPPKRGVYNVCVWGGGVTLWAEISSFQVSFAPGSRSHEVWLVLGLSQLHDFPLSKVLQQIALIPQDF